MSYDAEGVRRAVHDLLVAIGEDPERDGLRDTPERMARAYAEMFAGLDQDPAEHVERVFDVGHEEMVLVRDIPMCSASTTTSTPRHWRRSTRASAICRVRRSWTWGRRA